MLRNLFIALFLFALASPALAVPGTPVATSETAASDCHGMPMEDQDVGGEQHANSVRLHGCIGCIAPVSPVFGLVASALLLFISQSAPCRELSGTIAGPAMPLREAET